MLIPPSVAAISCDPSAPSSQAARGPRLVVSQCAALTLPTGHWWRQEHLNPVKGFALLPPTPLFALPSLLCVCLGVLTSGSYNASGHYWRKIQIEVRCAEMWNDDACKIKFSFSSWHWWPVTSNVTLPFGVMLALMLLKRSLQAETGATCISGQVSSFGLLTKTETLIIFRLTCVMSPFFVMS